MNPVNELFLPHLILSNLNFNFAFPLLHFGEGITLFGKLHFASLRIGGLLISALGELGDFLATRLTIQAQAFYLQARFGVLRFKLNLAFGAFAEYLLGPLKGALQFS